jgi:N-acetylmuramoyl-L-alanine amidase
MRKLVPRLLLAIVLVGLLLASGLPVASAGPTPTQPLPPICFWSSQGPVAVERPVEIKAAGLEADGLLAALLEGPTPEQEAQGLWTGIPQGTTLAGVEVRPDGTVIVRLRVPPEELERLDHGVFEVIVRQIGWTLESLGWRDLHIQTWDPAAEDYVSLADFLPELPSPRKETVLSEEEAPEIAAAYVGQPPAPGQGRPQGGLSGKTVYISPGHGWEWDYDGRCDCYRWKTQRPPYPSFPYVGPIIEDHNNGEAVNQYLLQYLWNAGAMVWPARERDMNGATVIVNNDVPGAGNSYVESGTWATGSQAGYDPNQPGQTYRWALTTAGEPTDLATWSAALPADGRYAVYVWYRPGSNRVPDAHYTVRHAGGETTVTVDQRHHGLTWHYIGTYGFEAAEGGQVVLSNRSEDANCADGGCAVIADAVRFGGGTFDSLAGIYTNAPYPRYKPWWEVATFYYAQRMGLEVGPDDYWNDIVARPIYSRWEHAGSGDDAVYVSWHTNGWTGYQWTYRGTMSIIHNGDGKPITPGSQALRDAIHAELVHDIRQAWDPTWPEYTRSMNLGELRELWDDDPAARMPGTLIEIAYHDHPGDTDALKEPTFEMLAARAVYQGIVRYFEQRDSVDLTLLPEPPTHLAVQNAGGGQVRVSWQPPLVDTAGVAGDPATGYRVYTSTNGLGWSDGVDVAGTSHTLAGLGLGQLLFVRVTATNAGGESFPTETLAARVGDAAGLLLVNGFDRLNRTMTVPDYDPVEGYNLRMLLDRMNSYDYVVQHGEVISRSFDSASNEAVRVGSVALTDYGVVDWILGEESAPDETLDSTERALLETFLDEGGALFLSGAEVGWHLDYLGADPAFYNAVLRADYAGDDANTYQVIPVSGSIFAGLSAFRFDAPGMYDADYADQISPINGSSAALAYLGGAGGTAAVQYDSGGCERLVYLGFPFETVWPDQRPAVMARVMDFLDECLPQERNVVTTISSPVDGSFYWTSVPSFAGLASATAGLQRVDVSLQRDVDGLYWDGANWGTDPWHVATGTTSWSFTMPLALDLGAYTAQARAWDTDGISDTTPAVAAFRFVVLDRSAYLPLALREFGLPPPACSDLIVNGGFETDEGWQIVDTSYPAAYTTTLAYEGARSMRVGIPVGRPGLPNGPYSYSSVSQTVSLPPGYQATLRYWVYPVYEATDYEDWQYVWLRYDGSAHLLYTARENLAAWVEREVDLTAFAGQTVKLHFSVRNDEDDDTAVMYLDQVRVEVCPP